jgi:hypothetical protein
VSKRPIPTWSGVVGSDGRIRIDAAALFAAFVKKFAGQQITVTVRKQARPKSVSQLGYLWGVVYPVAAEHFGYMDYETDALHDVIMRELRGLKPEPNPLKVRVSLAEMSHEEVSSYIEDVRHWLVTEHGCVTPDAHRAEAA